MSLLEDDKAAKNLNAAREQMRDLKTDLKAFSAEGRASDAQKAAHAALLKLPRLNSRPGVVWHSKLSAAKIDLDWYLSGNQ